MQREKTNIRVFDKSSFGERLRNVRELLDLTQDEISSKLDVKQGYYTKVENGRIEVGASFIHRLYMEFFPYFRWILTGQTDKDLKKSIISEDKLKYMADHESLIRELRRENTELSGMVVDQKEHAEDYKDRLERVEKQLQKALEIIHKEYK